MRLQLALGLPFPVHNVSTGTATCCLLLPWVLHLQLPAHTADAGAGVAAAEGGGGALAAATWPMWLMMVMLGVVQSGHVPSINVLRSHWYPSGEESSRLSACMSMGSRSGGIVGSALVPVLVAAVGVDSCFHAIAVVMVLGILPWVAVGASTPEGMHRLPTGTSLLTSSIDNAITQDELAYLAETTPSGKASALALAAKQTRTATRSSKASSGGESSGKHPGGAGKDFVDGATRLLCSPRAMAPVIAQLSENWTMMTLELYMPPLYTRAFGLSSVRAGALVASIKACGVAGPFVGLAFEAWCIRLLGKGRGYTTLQLRRFGTGTAIVAQAVGLCGIGAAR